MKQCKRCLLTEDIVTLNDNQCEYCDIHDKLESQSYDLDFELDKIRKHKGQYNCLIGISGGLDSSVLLYAAVRIWGLKPLVIHFDNHYNTPQAESNMNELISKLNINSIVYRVDKSEYDNLNESFLMSGTPDCDIPNDIAMTKLMYQTADFYDIKYILNGHDFRTEGSTPAKWTYMDARYIQDVYTTFSNRNLKNYPLFTFSDQIKYALKGIKQIRPFHFNFDRIDVEHRMKSEIKWQDYGGKHSENIYTEFIGAYVLPKKFNIDKRIVYLSALVRSGKMQKSEAELIMKIKPTFDLEKLGKNKDYFLSLINSPIQDRSQFKKYNFKRYKLLIYILYLLKVVPYTFYKKYT